MSILPSLQMTNSSLIPIFYYLILYLPVDLMFVSVLQANLFCTFSSAPPPFFLESLTEYDVSNTWN